MEFQKEFIQKTLVNGGGVAYIYICIKTSKTKPNPKLEGNSPQSRAQHSMPRARKEKPELTGRKETCANLCFAQSPRQTRTWQIGPSWDGWPLPACNCDCLIPLHNWVAVKELNLSYYIGETLLFTIYTHYGNLI